MQCGMSLQPLHHRFRWPSSTFAQLTHLTVPVRALAHLLRSMQEHSPLAYCRMKRDTLEKLCRKRSASCDRHHDDHDDQDKTTRTCTTTTTTTKRLTRNHQEQEETQDVRAKLFLRLGFTGTTTMLLPRIGTNMLPPMYWQIQHDHHTFHQVLVGFSWTGACNAVSQCPQAPSVRRALQPQAACLRRRSTHTRSVRRPFRPTTWKVASALPRTSLAWYQAWLVPRFRGQRVAHVTYWNLQWIWLSRHGGS